ncbi:MAG TPA: 4-alpha-glucanotransferase [Candidatus Wujingus californicus]|uniref:4-alpha-glucanotransferase n=1 Tax=Candidatus Wujingus californicus TaxID=3367618 RepID=UPI001D6F0FC6|nr:4-alpha-glucanotransferase [Planctomycetota bacterium]MDO8130702.1 4-alpha-glucanotransferase [Candidatus Brocadiales bacterium]
MRRRASGILLHITSLPSPYGIGDLGTDAYRFVDFLVESRQSIWQILPLNPTESALGNSPYYSPSAFASNTILISPDLLYQNGLLDKSNLSPIPPFKNDSTYYQQAIEYKKHIFRFAYERFKGKNVPYEYEQFCSENSYWLDDYALFVVLKEFYNGKIWGEWLPETRDRRQDALQKFRKQYQEKIELEKFLQYIFYKQWASLKKYCNDKGVQIIGDVPIYVCYDSADVWANPDLFNLDEKKRPAFVAGVPPDYFSKTGQLWGNPVYNWGRLKETGYKWWIQRIRYNLKLYDLIRIDHFRGFIAYWEVQVTEKTAINGHWVDAPAEDFFTTLKRNFTNLPVVAEDLGIITHDVREIMFRLGFPGMKILQFAFGQDLPTNPYILHNHVKNCIVYTGTHDNNTIRGWYEKEISIEDKERLFRYLGREVSVEEIHWVLIRLAMMSVANTVIFPMQDILGLDEKARMNRPSSAEGNWLWRLLPEQITILLIQRLREMTEIYGRA